MNFLLERSKFLKTDYLYFVIVGRVTHSVADFAVMGVRSKKTFDIIIRDSLPSESLNGCYPELNELLKQANERYDIEISRCCICAAGPVSRRRTHIILSNEDIVIDAKKILDNSLLNKVILVNDFEAIGYGLDILDMKTSTITLKHVGEDITAGSTQYNTYAVIGAGAGLGMTIVPYDSVRHIHVPLPSEGGHIDFCPNDEFEMEFVRFLKEKDAIGESIHPEMERAISQKGLISIYEFVRRKRLYPETEETRKIDALTGTEKISAIEVFSNRDETCRKAMDMFLKFYARAARTLALMSECYSGLFLFSRIGENRIVAEQDKFMAEFEKHDTKSQVFQKIPVYLITNKDIGLYGCCNVAANFYNLGGG